MSSDDYPNRNIPTDSAEEAIFTAPCYDRRHAPPHRLAHTGKVGRWKAIRIDSPLDKPQQMRRDERKTRQREAHGKQVGGKKSADRCKPRLPAPCWNGDPEAGPIKWMREINPGFALGIDRDRRDAGINLSVLNRFEYLADALQDYKLCSKSIGFRDLLPQVDAEANRSRLIRVNKWRYRLDGDTDGLLFVGVRARRIQRGYRETQERRK